MHSPIGRRIVTGVTTIGGVIAAALVASPGSVTAAPCTDAYPAGITTSVQLAVQDPFAVAGERVRATARVTSGEAPRQVPPGRLRVDVVDSEGAQVASRRAVLRDGTAMVVLPPGLADRATYTLRAHYLPRRCTVFTPAPPAQAHLTVFPRTTSRGR
jgi:hypothetical protein